MLDPVAMGHVFFSGKAGVSGNPVDRSLRDGPNVALEKTVSKRRIVSLETDGQWTI